MKRITLKQDERVIAVIPRRASGPGWANAPTEVYIEHRGTRSLRVEWIQPEERSRELHILYDVGEAMCSALIEAVPVAWEEASNET